VSDLFELTATLVDIRSESQYLEPETPEAPEGQEWAEGEWTVDPATGEQVWQPAEGGPAMSAQEWSGGDAPAPEA